LNHVNNDNLAHQAGISPITRGCLCFVKAGMMTSMFKSWNFGIWKNSFFLFREIEIQLTFQNHIKHIKN